MQVLRSPSTAADPSPHPERRIVLCTRGRRHGPIVRLMSPSDLGRRIKPFVFLDEIDIAIDGAPRFGFHPHSGIATLTVLLEGGFSYEDSTGATGEMADDSVEWMQAGGGVWHRGSPTGHRIRGYQLWIALPPALENAPPSSRYLEGTAFGHDGPARVVLGESGGVRSPIDGPAGINYLSVRLADGDAWRYRPPAGHRIAWIAVHRGRVRTPAVVSAGELAVFDDGDGAIVFAADGDSEFVLGSAVPHPHDLALGDYSVHTSPDALATGEAGIRRIAAELRRAGRL